MKATFGEQVLFDILVILEVKNFQFLNTFTIKEKKKLFFGQLVS